MNLLVSNNNSLAFAGSMPEEWHNIILSCRFFTLILSPDHGLNTYKEIKGFICFSLKLTYGSI
jgi:hypothetical protein